jgi:sorting nexin-7/30
VYESILLTYISSVLLYNYLFQYYLSQISPTVTKKLEVDGVATTSNGSGIKTNYHLAKLSLDNDLDTDEHDLFVHVDNPEKHTTTMETYITFRVTTKVN